MSAYRSNACFRNVDNRITDNRARGLESQTVYGARVSARFYGWMVFGMQIASCDWFYVRFYTVFWSFLSGDSSGNQHTVIRRSKDTIYLTRIKVSTGCQIVARLTYGRKLSAVFVWALL